MVLIGYSGHAFVVYGILKANGITVTGYCDQEEKGHNPFGLSYLGPEHAGAALDAIRKMGCFIAVGDNAIRAGIWQKLTEWDIRPVNAVHPAAVVDDSAFLSANGVMIAANATINPLATIGTGVICNTSCVIEHECRVGDFAHIGPGAVLCGNVNIGERSFVGANAVIRQGITIGSDVVIGAGAVVVKNVGDGGKVMGVPAK